MKHVDSAPVYTPAVLVSKTSEWADTVLSALGSSVESVLGCVNPKPSGDEKLAAKGTTVHPLPMEVDYKTLRDTLKESPELFETMLLQTIDRT